MRYLLKSFWTFMALLLLLEAWIWDTGGPAVGRVLGLFPIERVKLAIRAGIAWLPPYLTLFVFFTPALVLFPLKMASFWLFANGHPFLGIAAFLFAKTVGLAITAFLFEACKPNLMRLAWFGAAYGKVLGAKAWAHRMADPYLADARRSIARARDAVAARLPAGKAGRRIRLMRARYARRA